MSTSSTAPILADTLAPVAPPTVHDSGADTAPGVIVIHSCTTLGATLVVRLSGEIDHFSATPLRTLLASAADDGYTGLVLDTSRVTFADSGFLAILDWWPRHGRSLRLANPSRAVNRLLHAAAAATRQPARPPVPTPRRNLVHRPLAPPLLGAMG
ncbi:STAS domain-containing protein [Streptomyces sp. NBC_01310]|uniref:STAS domain-containing protein n=1 Tax=Streptomyces sp. NBC_01310 TaxID=2903820 RepID=UPI0035B66027|nr:STAS domain-containing protein [Streptomyces sp. NBC_01310]